jgi:plasmid stabilization system protein ParE
MSLPIRFLPEARAEYDDAVDWYAAHRDALGEDFILKVRQTLRQIAARPRMFSKIYGEARRARVQRYPYVVIFQIMTEEIAVISVFHTSRDPSHWQARLP